MTKFANGVPERRFWRSRLVGQRLSRTVHRSRVVLMLVAMVAAVPSAPAFGQEAGELVDRTLVIVGGSPITLSDVRTAIGLGLVRGGDVATATEQLVERALMLREVERYAPPEPERALVDARLSEVRARLDAAQYQAVLASGGFTEARLRGWLRDDVRIAAYLDQRFAADGPERREGLVSDWILDLRRRTPVVELWKR